MSVVVFAELEKGNIKKSTFEAVSYAKKVADLLQDKVVAVTAGSAEENVLESLGNYGADTVAHVNDNRLDQFQPQAFAKVIASVAESKDAKVIVFSHNYNGKAIAPRLSVKLKAGLVPGAVDLPSVDGSFTVKKAVFSGKAFANYEIKTDKKIISLLPNSFSVEETGGQATVEQVSVELSDNDFPTQVKEVKKVEGVTPLTEADLVVSAGRGLKGPENWNIIEDLAKAIGASTACSRPVADMEWRPHNEHVGQTGVAIRPNLYIAIGISGAIQHLAGVNGSKVIVVINKDPEAPFFKAADYGIVGDAFEVVPKLTEAVKKVKAPA